MLSEHKIQQTNGIGNWHAARTPLSLFTWMDLCSARTVAVVCDALKTTHKARRHKSCTRNRALLHNTHRLLFRCDAHRHHRWDVRICLIICINTSAVKSTILWCDFPFDFFFVPPNRVADIFIVAVRQVRIRSHRSAPATVARASAESASKHSTEGILCFNHLSGVVFGAFRFYFIFTRPFLLRECAVCIRNPRRCRRQWQWHWWSLWSRTGKDGGAFVRANGCLFIFFPSSFMFILFIYLFEHTNFYCYSYCAPRSIQKHVPYNK